MQKKFDQYTSVADAKMLPTPELARLASSSKKCHTLFHHLLLERKLLHHIVRLVRLVRENQNKGLVGENLSEIRILLTPNLDLLFKKAITTDLKGHSFYISPYEYILLKLSANELDTILSCIPKTEQGILVSNQLRDQFINPSHQLFRYVVFGDHEKVHPFFTNDISVLVEKRAVIDYSGRFFKHISPFEYALWASDYHMWNTMLAAIPNNEQGNKVLGELRSQFEALHTQGITYELNGVVVRESHFSLEKTIIKALQTQIDLAEAPYSAAWGDNLKKQWIEGVGSAQRLLPAHVVHEYCSTKAFNHATNFNTSSGVSKEYRPFLTERNGQTKTWFSVEAMIGSTVAIGKADSSYCHESLGACNSKLKVKEDLNTMKTLCNVRRNDFIHLAKRLGVTVPIAAPVPLTIDTTAEVQESGYDSSDPYFSPVSSSGCWYD